METIRVNMTPNPSDIQTIHCSQGDTEAREWEFELHNNGEVIDAGGITEQMVFKSYEGGTEQILPENGAVPVTAPFVGDIKYPDATRTDQEFLYRESPTEEDGLAKITDIKGNTLVWNQLVQNGNFADTSNWSTYNASLTVSNNIATITADAQWGRISNTPFELINAHKYLVISTVKGTTDNYVDTGVGNKYLTTNNKWETVSFIIEPTSTSNRSITIGDRRSSGWTPFYAKNTMCFDLTLMFGIGNEPSSIDEFTSLFTNPYYAYNAGTLLSFNGTGIKTVGRNLLSYSDENLPYNSQGVSISRTDDVYNVVMNNATGYPFARLCTIPYLKKGRYTVTMLGAGNSNGAIGWRIVDRSVSTPIVYYLSEVSKTTIDVTQDLHNVYFELTISAGTLSTGSFNVQFMLAFGTESEYEPYTSHTTNLPVSTYFPTGMKSAGNAYDELTPTKAITRIGAVDLGSLEWEAGGTNTQDIMRNKCTSLRNIISKPSSAIASANVVCINYATVSAYDTYIKTVGVSVDSVGDILVYDPNYNTPTSAGAFKTAMSGVYLYYELATETETPITTASLVTENAEIPLSNEDGVLIGECTEELSSESGFFDAKIKLADEDGECYSNKIQLHIERSPQ